MMLKGFIEENKPEKFTAGSTIITVGKLRQKGTTGTLLGKISKYKSTLFNGMRGSGRYNSPQYSH